MDFFWPEQRVVVEIDSYGWHRSRTQFENDRRRDAKLLLVGSSSDKRPRHIDTALLQGVVDQRQIENAFLCV